MTCFVRRLGGSATRNTCSSETRAYTMILLRRFTGRRQCSVVAKAEIPAYGRFHILDHVCDGDGGGSLLFELEVGGSKRMRAEAVVISHRPQPWQKLEGSKQSATVCVSSQAGCALDCTFCDTGRVSPAGNLPAWGIVEQVRAAQQLINPDVGRVVFMGMGEPLLNYSHVSAAIAALRSDETFARPWAITVSTVGVVPRISLLAKDHPQVALALSLHAPTQDLRKQLLPASASRWPLDNVMNAVEAHGQQVGRVAMFAYIVLPGVNDSETNACELAQLLCGPNCKTIFRPFINLVPYNPTIAGDQFGYKSPTNEELRAFRTLLRSKGIRATVRWSTLDARPISAACGQLTAKSINAASSEQLVDAGASRVKQGLPAACDETLSLTKLHAGDGSLDEGISIPAPVLTQQLSRAASCDDVLGLIERHSQNFNDIHASAALVTLARGASRTRATQRRVVQDPRFLQLLNRISELLPSFGAQACTNTFWTFGKLKFHPGSKFMTELIEVSKGCVESFWPQNLANSLWAYAKVRGAIDKCFVKSLLDATSPKLTLLTPVELANSAWSLAKLRQCPSDDFMRSWYDVAGRKMQLFKPQDLATTLWALAILRQTPSEAFLHSMLDQSENSPSFKPKEIANSSWACDQLNYSRGKSFFDALASQAAGSSPPK